MQISTAPFQNTMVVRMGTALPAQDIQTVEVRSSSGGKKGLLRCGHRSVVHMKETMREICYHIWPCLLFSFFALAWFAGKLLLCLLACCLPCTCEPPTQRPSPLLREWAESTCRASPLPCLIAQSCLSYHREKQAGYTCLML